MMGDSAFTLTKEEQHGSEDRPDYEVSFFDLNTFLACYFFNRKSILALSRSPNLDLAIMLLSALGSIFGLPASSFHYYMVSIGAVNLNPLLELLQSILSLLQQPIVFAILFILLFAVILRFTGTLFGAPTMGTEEYLRALFPVVPLTILVGIGVLCFSPFFIVYIWPLALVFFTARVLHGANTPFWVTILSVGCAFAAALVLSHPSILFLSSLFLLIAFSLGIVLSWGEWPVIGIGHWARVILLDSEAVAILGQNDSWDSTILVGILVTAFLGLLFSDVTYSISLSLTSFLFLSCLITAFSREWHPGRVSRAIFAVFPLVLPVLAVFFNFGYLYRLFPLLPCLILLHLAIPAFILVLLSRQASGVRLWQAMASIVAAAFISVAVNTIFAPLVLLGVLMVAAGAALFLREFS